MVKGDSREAAYRRMSGEQSKGQGARARPAQSTLPEVPNLREGVGTRQGFPQDRSAWSIDRQQGLCYNREVRRQAAPLLNLLFAPAAWMILARGLPSLGLQMADP
jgi:hypothetical protein